MQAYDVGLGEQFVQVVDVAGEPGRGEVVVDHPHREALGPLGDGLADSSVADEAQGGAIYVLAQITVELPLLPSAPAQIRLCVRRAPSRPRG